MELGQEQLAAVTACGSTHLSLLLPLGTVGPSVPSDQLCGGPWPGGHN